MIPVPYYDLIDRSGEWQGSYATEKEADVNRYPGDRVVKVTRPPKVGRRKARA